MEKATEEKKRKPRRSKMQADRQRYLSEDLANFLRAWKYEVRIRRNGMDIRDPMQKRTYKPEKKKGE